MILAHRNNHSIKLKKHTMLVKLTIRNFKILMISNIIAVNLLFLLYLTLHD